MCTVQRSSTLHARLGSLAQWLGLHISVPTALRAWPSRRPAGTVLVAHIRRAVNRHHRLLRAADARDRAGNVPLSLLELLKTVHLANAPWAFADGPGPAPDSGPGPWLQAPVPLPTGMPGLRVCTRVTVASGSESAGSPDGPTGRLHRGPGCQCPDSDSATHCGDRQVIRDGVR